MKEWYVRIKEIGHLISSVKMELEPINTDTKAKDKNIIWETEDKGEILWPAAV